MASSEQIKRELTEKCLYKVSMHHCVLFFTDCKRDFAKILALI